MQMVAACLKLDLEQVIVSLHPFTAEVNRFKIIDLILLKDVLIQN